MNRKSNRKTLTFLLMDGPFESARTTTVLRMVDLAIQSGHDVNVFAYEGAAALSFAGQAGHANAVHGRDAEEEDHPLPKEWVSGLYAQAKKHAVTLDWINCGLCVDERGVNESVPGPRRGTPADFWQWAESSDNALVVPTK